MIKKILLAISVLMTGFIIALYSDSFLRFKVRDIYLLSTFNKIEFIGKDFFFFNNVSYYIATAVTFLILYLANSTSTIVLFLKNSFIAVFIFIITLLALSAIDANLKLIQCTACDDGIKELKRNDINYSLLILSALFASIIPSLILLIKNRNKSGWVIKNKRNSD
ncbi:hypothetical protein QSV08_02255 [Maribacter sp. BPC-D8]|uniref:hypothetical protein n=1 Tax=Maribacter sp. BPC-D8 TaxID=3053613 RepID=UPI002B47ACB9|nr:hypothetical protein [Maribacter sp. BPC-D8]WRI30064.1 hypothetical protein QSV08_02255 [Maribacter sp. BPC-D8]